MHQVYALILAAIASGIIYIEAPVGGSTITPSFTAQPLGHSTECIAPCLVLFDAQATTDSSVTRPFHELDYQWSFNDSAPGTGVTGYDLNYARGRVASHMFETPGTYSTSLEVCNPLGACATTSSNVVVQDPLTYFSGSIYCVSTGTNFANWCPSGATQIGSQTDFRTALITTPNVDAASVWVVLNCGETWEMSGGSINTINHSANPGLISSRSTTGGVCGTKPLVNIDPDEHVFQSGDNWTYSGIDIAGDNTTPTSGDGCYTISVFGETTRTGIVISRSHCYDIMGAASVIDVGVDIIARNVGVWGSSFAQGSNNNSGASSGSLNLWAGVENGVIQNSTLDGKDSGEFTIRFIGFRNVVVADNLMKDAGGAADQRNLLQLRCTDPGVQTCSNTVVSRNTFVARGNSVYSHVRVCRDGGCNPPGTTESGIVDLLIEGNFFTYDRSITTPGVPVVMKTSNTTVRNNILDLRGLGASHGTIYFSQLESETGGTDDYSNNHVFNNTVYTNSTSTFNYVWCVNGETLGTGHRCYNNLAYFPNQTGTVTATSGTNWTAATNIDSATSPFDFVDTPPTIYTSVYSDFDLKLGDTIAIDQGTDIDATFANSLHMDAWELCRGGTPDIGAHEYGASGC